MKHSPFVFFQVFLVLQFPWNTPTADSLQLWTLPYATRPDSWTKPPFLDEIVKFGWQPEPYASAHPAISFGSAGYNLQPDSVFLGHDTAFNMKHSPFVFFQVFLVLQFPWNTPTADSLQLWTLPNATRPDSWTKPPFLDEIVKFGWQPEPYTSAHPAISVGSAGYNLQPDSVFLGHDTAFNMKHSPFVFFQ
ncbi:hypothetical protein V5799_024034, partial [Amblyomma americanum]